MIKKQWIWLFVMFFILNLIFFAITLYNVLEIEMLYKNIIRGVLTLLTLCALGMAFFQKNR